MPTRLMRPAEPSPRSRAWDVSLTDLLFPTPSNKGLTQLLDSCYCWTGLLDICSDTNGEGV